MSDSLGPHGLQHARLPSITNSQRFVKLVSIESVMPSNHLILSCPLLFLPSIFPSIRVFSNESVLHIRWTKVLEFQLWHKSFQWIFRADFLEDWLVWSPCSPRDSQESSPTPQFKSICSRGQYSIVEERLGIRGTWFWFWSIYPSTLDIAGYSVWGILKLFRPLLCRQWNGQSWG